MLAATVRDLRRSVSRALRSHVPWVPTFGPIEPYRFDDVFDVPRGQEASALRFAAFRYLLLEIATDFSVL